MGFSVIKSFKAEKNIAALHDRSNGDVAEASKKRTKVNVLVSYSSGIAGAILQFGVFFVAAALALSGKGITAGTAILKLDGYTRVIVTHDLDENILRRCTGLFALKNGAVSEQGTFEALMAQKGCFYSLFTVSQR